LAGGQDIGNGIGEMGFTMNFICPACGKALRADRTMLGKPVRCGDCDHVFVTTEEESEGGWENPPLLMPEHRTQDNRGKAVAGLVLGICGLIAWFIPIIGLPVTVIGLVMGIKGLKSSGQGMAVAGIVLSSIGLVLTLINSALGAYIAATGRMPFAR